MGSENLWKKIGGIETNISNIKEQLSSIDDKLNRLNLTPIVERVSIVETVSADHQERLKKLEENQSRLVWFVVLAVVGAILKLVILNQ